MGAKKSHLTPSESSHLLNEMKTDDATRNMVLLDSGSNEVVMTYNGWEWQQIVDRKPHTRNMNDTLALNQHMEAGITAGGELMRAPPKYGNQMVSKGHWICPIGRMRTELGLYFMWTARGPIITGCMLSEPIRGVEINGLPYIDWSQFQPNRWALQQSHQAGMHAAKIHCGSPGDEMNEMQKSKSGPLPGGQSKFSQVKRGERYARSEERSEYGRYGRYDGQRNRQRPTSQEQLEGFAQTPVVDDGEGWILWRRRRSPSRGENAH